MKVIIVISGKFLCGSQPCSEGHPSQFLPHVRKIYPTGPNDWMIHSLPQSTLSRFTFLQTEGFHANPGSSEGQGKPKGTDPCILHMVDTSYIWNPVSNTELTNP